MRDLNGKVAVVTGGASGLGRAMATHFAREGMHVAIADVDQASLDVVAGELRALGVRAIGVRTDVSRAAEVDALATRVVADLGGVHVVCNNAGISPLGAAWENTLADWEWMLGVNLWGVIHGVRAFTPLLLARSGGNFTQECVDLARIGHHIGHGLACALDHAGAALHALHAG